MNLITQVFVALTPILFLMYNALLVLLLRDIGLIQTEEVFKVTVCLSPLSLFVSHLITIMIYTYVFFKDTKK